MIAAYHAAKIRSIENHAASGETTTAAPNSIIIIPQPTPGDGSGDGSGSDGLYPCDLCSGEIPNGQAADADCLADCNMIYAGGTGVARWRYLDPNVTCWFDFGSGASNCDMDATNSGGGSAGSGNLLISYLYFFISKQYDMKCNAISQTALASGHFSDSRGNIVLFPVRVPGGGKYTFSIGSVDNRNTSMREDYFSFPKFFAGFCAGAN